MNAQSTPGDIPVSGNDDPDESNTTTYSTDADTSHLSQCQNCDIYVSQTYARVNSDNDETLHRCQLCVGQARMANDAGADPNYELRLMTDGGEDVNDPDDEDDAPPVPDDTPPEETEDVPVENPDDTDDDDVDGNDDLLPDAMKVFSEAKSTIASLEQLENDDDMMAEVKAISTFAEDIGGLIAAGLDESDAHAQCGQLANVSTYNKSQLKKKVNSAAQKAKNQSSSRRTFKKVLENDLVEVVKVKSSDSHQRTIYRWHFRKGTVETRQSKDETHSHFSWHHFRDDYYDATGEMPYAPSKTLQDGERWREFVTDIIHNRGREEPNKGPRTCAIDELKGYIRSSIGYAELEDALQFDGVYIDDDPENGNPDEVWVSNSTIKRICDNNELGSTRALQLELDARNLTSTDIAGVSDTKTINSRSVTFWRLRVDLATPAEYVLDPKTPAQRVATRNAQQDDDGSQGSGKIDSVTDDSGGDGDE